MDPEIKATVELMLRLGLNSRDTLQSVVLLRFDGGPKRVHFWLKPEVILAVRMHDRMRGVDMPPDSA